MRYRRGTSRYQQNFLSIDDLITKKNIIRIIDKVCEEYCQGDSESPFGKGDKETGRKAYHPADLLKILVYGYFNGISSSRKIERECGRNVELKWLTSGLVPDHKTISDFRKDNPEMIEGLFSYLIAIFKEKGLVTGKSVAVDGTKIKAYASQEIDITTLKGKLEDIEEQVEEYLKKMAAIDQAEDEIEDLSEERSKLREEVERLEEKKSEYEEYLKYFEGKNDKKICTTDPESRMMSGRSGKFWGYNVQSVVDTEHHMITNVRVTNNQNDKGLLSSMLEASEETCGQVPKEALADAGYYKVNELEQLEEKEIECYVAINLTASQAKDQRNGISFTYDEEEDRYYCHEGKKLDFLRKKRILGKEMSVYQGTECEECSIKSSCTRADKRTVHRNKNQLWIDDFHEKMQSEEGKVKLTKRKATAEHPFGTIKYDMGQIPLLLKGNKKVQSEMNLYAIGYNLKRYFNIITERDNQWTNSKMKQAA